MQLSLILEHETPKNIEKQLVFDAFTTKIIEKPLVFEGQSAETMQLSSISDSEMQKTLKNHWFLMVFGGPRLQQAVYNLTKMALPRALLLFF